VRAAGFMLRGGSNMESFLYNPYVPAHMDRITDAASLTHLLLDHERVSNVQWKAIPTTPS